MHTFQIKLKPAERKRLNSIVRKGSERARKINRCRILLLCHENKKRTEIASLLGLDNNTVSNVCRRYLEEGLEAAIHEKPRSGAPALFDGKSKAKITALACSSPPEGNSQWSLRLLADKAVELKLVKSISHTKIGQILKKTR